LVAVGDDFFDTTAGASRQNMTENGNKRHEHLTSSFRRLATCKADASRGWSAFGCGVDQRSCGGGLGCCRRATPINSAKSWPLRKKAAKTGVAPESREATVHAARPGNSTKSSQQNAAGIDALRLPGSKIQ
jgi:hypothetical protein